MEPVLIERARSGAGAAKAAASLDGRARRHMQRVRVVCTDRHGTPQRISTWMVSTEAERLAALVGSRPPKDRNEGPP